ncbi:MAG: threonine/serine exporter family protein [Corynebacterium sp.]|nr:threonine/serine exporter family protein [Corynebacterium sp.]
MFQRIKRLFVGEDNTATIDVVRAAPPPSPLAPVDLTDPGQVAGVMDLAGRIGGILLASGTSNNDSKAQIKAVASAYGLHYCHVDITLNTITIFAYLNSKKQPLSVFHSVRRLSIDFSKLSDVDQLVRSITAGATPPDVAERALDDIMSAKPPFGFRMSLVGWALMAAAVAIMLGGGFMVAVLAFATTSVIVAGMAWLDRRNLPLFFQNLYGGLIATVPAAITYKWAMLSGIELPPSQVIASGIIVMLAGLTLVQALQDGITGAPVTASARFFETILLTGGIVAGVGLGIELSGALGVTLPTWETTAVTASVSSVMIKVISGAAASAAFAIACYAKWDSVFVSALTALAGSFIYYCVLIPHGVGPIVATAISATVIGLAGGLLARRFSIPPLITAVAGITPLLPGLSIYRAMYAMMHDQMLMSYSLSVIALGTASALAAGVVLGEWIARKLRRPPRFNPYKAFRRRPKSAFQRSANN